MSPRATVLIVEDNPLNRELVEAVLEPLGLEIRVAVDVPSGRAELARGRPDLILMDIDIPGGGGVLLLHELRADPALAAVPVLAVTSFAMHGDRERFLAEGFDGYISKPIDVATVVRTLQPFLPEAK